MTPRAEEVRAALQAAARETDARIEDVTERLLRDPFASAERDVLLTELSRLAHLQAMQLYTLGVTSFAELYADQLEDEPA